MQICWCLGIKSAFLFSRLDCFVEICLKCNVLSHEWVVTRPKLTFDNNNLDVNDDDDGDEDCCGDVVDYYDNYAFSVIHIESLNRITRNIIIIKFSLNKTPCYILSSLIHFLRIIVPK